MKTREQLIEEFLQTPIQVGESMTHLLKWYKVVEVCDDYVLAKNESYFNASAESILIKDLKRSVRHIGYKPFVDTNRFTKVINWDLDGILRKFNKDEFEKYFKQYVSGGVNELNWNPFVTLSNGEKFYYQRDFVWTLNNKQNLIQSLYKGLELGRIVVYKREYELVEKELKQGNLDVCFYDVVDGKQRLKTIFDFINNKFCDKSGYYWKDISMRDQYNILSQQTLIYIELDTQCTSKDILQTFLNNAVEGVKLDTNHLQIIETKLSQL